MPLPAELRLKLNERWPGDVDRGNAILAGNIDLAGEAVRNPMPVWLPAGAGEAWLAAWHGFGWLPDLISVGAYVAGTDPQLDQAIALMPRIDAFLRQDMNTRESFAPSLAQLQGLFADPADGKRT